MRGYWNDEAATAEALENGWLRTGDLGRMDEEGYVFVTDRKKDLIVTAQGKKVAPQLVESRLRASPLIDEAVVTGDRRPFLVALIFPDLDVLRARSGLALSEGGALRETLAAPAVHALLRAEIDRACEGLAPHETVREFCLLPARPEVSDGGLTPTQKLRRGVIERRYAEEIRALYRADRG
jgi:long-chain acyl-CoA synthetase